MKSLIARDSGQLDSLLEFRAISCSSNRNLEAILDNIVKLRVLIQKETAAIAGAFFSYFSFYHGESENKKKAAMEAARSKFEESVASETRHKFQATQKSLAEETDSLRSTCTHHQAIMRSLQEKHTRDLAILFDCRVHPSKDIQTFMAISIRSEVTLGTRTRYVD